MMKCQQYQVVTDKRCSKERLSEKKVRNESDDETSTTSNEDIFSSSDKEGAESSEEINDSDESEEADPWGVLIHEAAMELCTKHNELVQSFQTDSFSETDAKKQAFLKFYETFDRNWEIFIWIA